MKSKFKLQNLLSPYPFPHLPCYIKNQSCSIYFCAVNFFAIW